MKILVVGGGGREHAIIKKLRENKEITKIYALPGNGGEAGEEKHEKHPPLGIGLHPKDPAGKKIL